VQRAILDVFVAALVALAFISGLGASTFLLASHAVTITTSRGHSVTLVSGSTASSNSSGVLTTREFPAAGSIVLKVLNNPSRNPVQSLPVQVNDLASPCPPNPHTTEDLGVLNTKGSGIISVGDLGECYFRFPTYGNYSVSASIAPEKVACVTVSLPSQQLETNYSATFSFRC
jgi:hypothetical protein